MTIGAVVILYNPDESVTTNIQSYINDISKLYIIDNSEQKHFDINSLAGIKTDVIYIKNETNEGIAKSLNKAIELGIKDELDYILTMDQDSSFKKDDFTRYLHLVEKHPLNKQIAMFSVNFQPKVYSSETSPFFVESTITSGAIMNLSLCTIIGQFNEKLFIDLVDLEYCFRINRNNYKILVFPDMILNHNLGYIVQGRSLLTWKRTPRILHSPIRLYYILRNSLFILNNFNPTKAEKKEIKNCLLLIKNNLLYNDKKIVVIKYLLKAYCDYKNNRMGKIR